MKDQYRTARRVYGTREGNVWFVEERTSRFSIIAFEDPAATPATVDITSVSKDSGFRTVVYAWRVRLADGAGWWGWAMTGRGATDSLERATRQGAIDEMLREVGGTFAEPGAAPREVKSRASRFANVEYYDRGAREVGPSAMKTLRVVFEDAGYDRTNVRRADNNRLLGWVYQPDGHTGRMWRAYIADEAFRGDDVDDIGMVMDAVPEHLALRTAGYDRIERRSRRAAIGAMLTVMSENKPPALGYGRHRDVNRYHGNNEAKRAWVRNGYEGSWQDYIQ